MTRLVSALDAIVRLGGPIWFERRLITHLDTLARTPVGAIG
ncbi:hypothetical protein ACFXHA_27110 [Nocardia sp. NPDC059240]